MLSIAFVLFALGGLIVNAALTAQFGWQFCGGWFGALLMLMFFDIAAVSWYVARLQTGLSAHQRATAKMMSVFTIVGSTLVSIIQVLLTTQIVDLTPYFQAIGIFGVILITVTTAANFFALFYFQFTSVAESSTELAEEVSAQMQEERARTIREANDKAVTRAHAMLMGKTDAIAERLADDAEKEFLNMMGCLDMYVAPEDRPTPPADTRPVPEAKAMTQEELTNLLDARLAKALEAFQGAAAGAKKGKKSKAKKAKPAAEPEATTPLPEEEEPTPPSADRAPLEWAFDDEVEYEELEGN